MTKHKHELVLAVHPTSRGFGWVLFENPLMPVDWGLATVKAKRSAQSLARFEKLLNRYEPKVVVFEQFGEEPARRANRIQELCRQMISLAGARGLNTPIYSRETIRQCFESSGAKTRRDIAVSIAERITVFRKRLPRERRRWDSEDVRQSLFDAVALALTHFAVSGHQVAPTNA
jgi:Holliday junction resolvasome RuvABC endonuclease subunit